MTIFPVLVAIHAFAATAVIATAHLVQRVDGSLTSSSSELG